MAPLATLTVRLQAQIAEFQADFKEAAGSAKQFQDEFQGTATKAVAAGTLIGRGLEDVIRAVGRYGQAILENASDITDLSAKTGLAMRTIQQFQYVAEQTGTTVDAFSNAAFNLGVKIAGGSNSTVQAVKDLGLSFDDIKRLSPDQQFIAVADALGKMEAPQKRNQIGMELYGRTFREIAPAISEGYSKMARDANESSDEQIKALDKAGDAWGRFHRNSLASATSWAGNIVLQIEEVGKVGDRLTFWERLSVLLPGSTAGMARFADELARVRREANDLDLSEVIADMQRVALLSLKPEGGPPLLQAGTADYRAIEDALNDSIKRQNKSWDEAGKAATAAMDKAKAAAEAYTASVKALADELSGKGLEGDVKKLEDAFRLLTNEQKKQPDILNRVSDAAEKLRQDGARLSPELQSLAVKTQAFSEWLNKIDGQKEVFGQHFDELRNALPGIIVPLKDVQVALDEIENSRAFAKMRDALPLAKLQDVDVALRQIKDAQGGLLDGFKESLERVPAILANGFANGNVRGAITDIGSMLGSELGKSLGESLGKNIAGLSAQWGGLIGGALGSLIGPLIDKIADLFGSKGRDMVKEFAESFGGFDELRGKLDVLGAAGETLWVRLTQGVGRNNPREAAAAIDAINAALERQAAFIAELTSIYAPKLEALYASASGSGELLSESMIPFIEQARSAGVITDELAEKLLGLTTDNSASWQQMEDAAKRYGIELGALGATFQQQKLTDTASQIIRDFDMLIRNGADFNGVLAGMQDEINQVVLDSLKFGTEIPENMRPWIQALVDAGLLLDASGEKITGIDKLKFGPVIKSDIENLNDTIKLLIEALTKGVGGAIDTLNTRSVRIPVKYDVDASGLNTGPLGGIFTTGGATQTINVNLDGGVLTSAVVRGMPAELELNGV